MACGLDLSASSWLTEVDLANVREALLWEEKAFQEVLQIQQRQSSQVFFFSLVTIKKEIDTANLNDLAK